MDEQDSALPKKADKSPVDSSLMELDSTITNLNNTIATLVNRLKSVTSAKPKDPIEAPQKGATVSLLLSNRIDEKTKQISALNRKLNDLTTDLIV